MLMDKRADKQVNILLERNAVIRYLPNVPLELQQSCLKQMVSHVEELNLTTQKNMDGKPNSTPIGKSIWQQQIVMAKVLQQ